MSGYESGGPLSPSHEAHVREIAEQVARQEIASLAGKALRRSQDVTLTRSPIHNESEAAANRAIAHFWGEVLAEYGGEQGAGD